jgi:hypothetical protein
MNQNIPYIQAYVRNSYLHNLENVEGVTECYIFGVKCLLNKPLLFHCQLENGAVFWGLPISAFVTNDKYETIGESEEAIINELIWWNCQSSDCDITVFHYLEGYYADLRSRTGKTRRGKYLFTLDDFYDNRKNTLGYAEDTDSKCYHVFKLDNGWIAAYPNDKIRWYNLNFVDRSLAIPRYKAFQTDIRAENVI